MYLKREMLENAVNQYSTANNAMCSAIEENVKELINGDSDNIILFKNEIDCASCLPLVQLEYNENDDCTYGVSDVEDYISLEDLTGNELFEICNQLMVGNYFVCNKEYAE